MRPAAIALAVMFPLSATAQVPDYVERAEKNISIRKAPSCVCVEEQEGVRELTGFVVDAVVTLAPDGFSTNPRQATIFDVVAGALGQAGRTEVFHLTDPDQCGVTFNYGRKYKIRVRMNEKEELETDSCLMAALARSPQGAPAP